MSEGSCGAGGHHVADSCTANLALKAIDGFCHPSFHGATNAQLHEGVKHFSLSLNTIFSSKIRHCNLIALQSAIDSMSMTKSMMRVCRQTARQTPQWLSLRTFQQAASSQTWGSSVGMRHSSLCMAASWARCSCHGPEAVRMWSWKRELSACRTCR